MTIHLIREEAAILNTTANRFEKMAAAAYDDQERIAMQLTAGL